MSDTLRLIYEYLTLPKANISNAKLTGSGLFLGEYKNKTQFKELKKLFSKHTSSPIVRIPFLPDEPCWKEYFTCLNTMQSVGCVPLILFDCLFSDANLTKRIKELRKSFPQAQYFELFNELPHMPYPGQQMGSLSELIIKTNDYCALIKSLFPNAKVISMAPANMLAEMKYTKEWGGDNTTQLKRLAYETTADIVGVHIYVNNWREKARFKRLMKTMNGIKSGTGKDCWITEIGADDWRDHVDIFEQWSSRAYDNLPLGEAIWYRQAIAEKSLPDGDFALHDIKSGEKSPLWGKLS